MKQIAIYGASGCGRGVMPIARKQWLASGEPHQLVFVDDNPSRMGVNGHAVISYDEWLNRPGSNHLMNVAIANSSIRQSLVERCIADGVEFFEIRASNVVQLDAVTLGDGAILCPFVTLTSNIRIGHHFHANLYSYVEHDCILGDYVTFAPGVKCNGNVIIEDHVYVGSGAVIKQGQPDRPLVIGRNATIGMGAVVTKNVLPNSVVVGNPAKLYLKAIS
jgi:sugar O-acyltransferase (sialic acid O-acetyltransferase NeuD family)